VDISIFGLGYVGAVSLACLARDGHRVVGVDVDQAKLDLIASGRTPVVEEGMVELMREVVASGAVRVTRDEADAVRTTELSFICVGTPSSPNGSQDQSAMLRVAADLGRALKEKAAPHVFVFRSTLVPGTVEDVLTPILERESGCKEGTDFHVCYQPEFLREGSSIKDYGQPPFTIVGGHDEAAVGKLKSLFGALPCEFHSTSVRTAEMVKYCCNNFHALKITFANETARLCEALRVDPFEVMDLVCRDRQLNISPAYLHDVELPVLGAVIGSNRTHIEHAIAKVLATGKRRIGMIGLSFKSGTDDLRESPFVALAEHLIGKGLRLLVYDAEVQFSRLLGANRRFIEERVPHIGSLIRSDLAAVIAESEVLVVGLTDAQIAKALETKTRPDQVVIDLARLPNGDRLPARYEGLCWQ